jgi:hypothetical protein
VLPDGSQKASSFPGDSQQKFTGLIVIVEFALAGVVDGLTGGAGQVGIGEGCQQAPVRLLLDGHDPLEGVFGFLARLQIMDQVENIVLVLGEEVAAEA